VALLASGHAAFETGGQIGITNIVEDGDDLKLDDVGDFHFALGRHASIYVAIIACDGRRVGLEASVEEVVGTLEPDRPHTMGISTLFVGGGSAKCGQIAKWNDDCRPSGCAGGGLPVVPTMGIGC